jgi:hypothetical protein
MPVLWHIGLYTYDMSKSCLLSVELSKQVGILGGGVTSIAGGFASSRVLISTVGEHN